VLRKSALNDEAASGPHDMSAYWLSLGPWLAVAGLGALHGLNPATGWMFAAGWAVRSRDRTRAWRALLPIATGHAASIALVAIAVPLSLSMGRVLLLALAGGLLAVVAIAHCSGRKLGRAPTGHVGLALWSFMMSTLHGAGLMLVPTLIPLCMANTPGREIVASGSLAPALAAVGVHTVTMLAVTGVMASGVCRCFDIGWVRILGRSVANAT
jgi:hypothetical protein